MDSSYQHQPQTMGPYYFYNSDPKLENQTHAYYTELAESIQNSMYHQRWPQPSLPLNSSFSRPRSSASSIPIPISQGYQSNFPNISHTNSTSTLYQKPHFVNQDQTPRLMVDSNIQEPDLYCFPSTPPLSATASVIGSPFLYQGLPTPLNAPLFCLDQGKDNKIVNENRPHPEWVGCGSPPVTPVFLHPNSLITNTSEALPTHYQFLSPSPSPYSVPTLTQQQNFDYCDPRNLTVLPVGQINQPLLKTASPQAFASSTVIAHEGEEKKKIVRSDLQSHENFARNAGPPLSENLGQLLCEQHPEFRTEEFVNGLTGFSPENARYYPSKRRRSNSILNSDSSHGETLVSAVEFKNLNDLESLTSACPPSPPLSIHESKLQSQQASRKGRKIRSPKDQPVLNTQIQTQILTSSMSGGKEKSHLKDNNNQAEISQLQNMSPGIENTNPVESDTTPAPTTRRGRKQSLTHDPTKIFGCAGCSRKFRRQEHMKRHFRSLHTNERPFLCPDCGKRFSRSDNLTQHSRTHGSGSVVMKVRKPREMSIDGNGGSDNKVPIQILGNDLYTTAAAISGSESDLTSLPNSSQPANSDHDVHTQKKRKSSS